MALLRLEMQVDRPVEEVFDFFADAWNLERITPPELRFRILTPSPIHMKQGTLIDYRLSLFGVRVGWRTLISDWTPPFRFVDEQLQGPYREWVHTHTFARIPGGTLIRDEVMYRLPFGILGWRNPSSASSCIGSSGIASVLPRTFSTGPPPPETLGPGWGTPQVDTRRRPPGEEIRR
ncbi:MAG: SRPBCC family protein [Gemmatimonadota bacterium]